MYNSVLPYYPSSDGAILSWLNDYENWQKTFSYNLYEPSISSFVNLFLDIIDNCIDFI